MVAARDTDIPIRMIEVNPFDEFTDSAMFKWAAHKKQLSEGPFEIRVVTQEEICLQKQNWWRKVPFCCISPLMHAADRRV